MSKDPRDERGRLSETIAESRSAVNQNGSVMVTIPKETASDLGIEPGSEVFFTGREGDEQVSIEPYNAERLLD